MLISIQYNQNIFLRVLPPEAMTIQIEWITASLGPSPVQLTFPLNSTKGPDMPTSRARGRGWGWQSLDHVD